jgi:hypothetical protein
MRWTTRLANAAGCAAASSLIALAVAGPASAANPGGTCTNSYSPYTREQFVGLGTTPDQQQLFAEIFDVVNNNGDAIVCFKFYPNGPHHGHPGNVVDNNAAPHQ